MSDILPLLVMPVLVLGIGKRVGDCDGLSFCSRCETCARSFEDEGLPASLTESSSDEDESADSTKKTQKLDNSLHVFGNRVE